MALIMDDGALWSVPLSVGIGIPMYTNAVGISYCRGHFEQRKGFGGCPGLYDERDRVVLPEMIILRKRLKPRLIAVFTALVGSGILLVACLFNFLV
ncbi:MAG: hypothetical protein ACQES5_03335 [Thermodesulfobacteriota bacterium]